MTVRTVILGQYLDYRTELRGTLAEVLAVAGPVGAFCNSDDTWGGSAEYRPTGWTGYGGEVGTTTARDALPTANLNPSVFWVTVQGVQHLWTGTVWVQTGFYPDASGRLALNPDGSPAVVTITLGASATTLLPVSPTGKYNFLYVGSGGTYRFSESASGQTAVATDWPLPSSSGVAREVTPPVKTPVVMGAPAVNAFPYIVTQGSGTLTIEGIDF